MTDSRPAKLARLQELKRSVPYVSKSALAAILKDIEKKGCLLCVPGNIYWNLQSSFARWNQVWPIASTMANSEQ